MSSDNGNQPEPLGLSEPPAQGTRHSDLDRLAFGVRGSWNYSRGLGRWFIYHEYASQFQRHCSKVDITLARLRAGNGVLNCYGQSRRRLEARQRGFAPARRPVNERIATGQSQQRAINHVFREPREPSPRPLIAAQTAAIDVSEVLIGESFWTGHRRNPAVASFIHQITYCAVSDVLA
ncbi:hypothetical protein ACJJTC_017804 [Scirpophaga incertulas]